MALDGEGSAEGNVELYSVQNGESACKQMSGSLHWAVLRKTCRWEKWLTVWRCFTNYVQNEVQVLWKTSCASRLQLSTWYGWQCVKFQI